MERPWDGSRRPAATTVRGHRTSMLRRACCLAVAALVASGCLVAFLLAGGPAYYLHPSYTYAEEDHTKMRLCVHHLFPGVDADFILSSLMDLVRRQKFGIVSAVAALRQGTTETYVQSRGE